jgi:hypothetical protein
MRGMLILAACVALVFPTTSAAADMFSATRPVIAILASELFVGEAEGHLNGAGTLTIRSQKDPGLACVGQFTSSPELGGSGELRCNDQTSATFIFQRLSVFRGHGAGRFSRGPMSFAYGLTVEEARPYLKLPDGKRLAHNGTELQLIDL